MEAGVQEKLKHLKDLIAGYDGLAVAFSGGVDSTFLLMCAREVLGPRVLALTINGPHISPAEFLEAKRFCESHDISQLVITMPDDLFASIAENPPDRCYICKRGMFEYMLECIDGLPLADGSNADDAGEHRPGRRALKELGIVSPLAEAGFTILATGETCRRIAEAGVPVTRVLKQYEGRPNVLDLITNGQIQLVINSPVGKGAIHDDGYLRKSAIRAKIPYITTVAAARAAAEGILEIRKNGNGEIHSLQEWHGMIS